MRVIILENQNLNKTFYKNFELDCKNNKIDFQFWSLLPLTNKELFKLYSDKKFRTISHPKFILIKSYKHLFKKINSIKRKTYFLNLSADFFSHLIEFFLIRKGCLKIERFEQTNIHNTNIYADFKRVLNYGHSFLIKKIARRIKINFQNFLLKNITTEPSYYITPDKRSYVELKKKVPSFKIIKYNSSIFNQFKKLAYQESRKKNIVFIDQELEACFESKVTNNSQFMIDKQKYWHCLNEIFERFEKKLKIKIIIAAHFRRSKDKKSLPNIGRKFVFDKTPELIKNSKLVIGHHSTALNYAILMRKPIVLLDFKVFDRIALVNHKRVNFLRKEISPKIIHINNMYKFKFNKKTFKDLLKINKKKYNNFKNYYVSFSNYKNVHKNIWSAISSIK
tara:strand:- start:293 stop:1471 length:1179 start_codon:yes stop_codon:yes gene_type:complete